MHPSIHGIASKSGRLSNSHSMHDYKNTSNLQFMGDSNGDSNDDGEDTRVRWLIDVARYTAAALVTAVTVAVIARAVTVSLRSERITIEVANSSVSVSVKGSPPAPVTVSISLNLLSYNPSGRVGVQYSNVNMSLLDRSGKAITWLSVPNGTIHGIVVGPTTARQTLVRGDLVVPDEVPSEFAERMRPRSRNGTTSAGQEIKEAAVHLRGILQTQISGFTYSHGGVTAFRCFPVTIGVPPLHLSAGDAPCDEVPP
ncbi:hypothetical protein ACQJBY_062052 [Aegilops geniculata]